MDEGQCVVFSGKECRMSDGVSYVGSFIFFFHDSQHESAFGFLRTVAFAGYHS